MFFDVGECRTKEKHMLKLNSWLWILLSFSQHFFCIQFPSPTIGNVGLGGCLHDVFFITQMKRVNSYKYVDLLDFPTRVYLMISKNRRVMKGSTKMDLFEVGEVGVEPKKMFLDPEKKTICLSNRPFYQSMVVSGFFVG